MRNRLVLILALTLAIPAFADGNEEVAHAKTELALKEEAQQLKDTCGKVPTVAVDWASFPKDFGNYSISGYCSSTINSLRRLCDGKSRKAYVKKTLKTITCKHAAKDKRKLSSKGGNIVVEIDFEASNYDEWARREILRSF